MPVTDADEPLTKGERVAFACDQVMDIVRKLWPLCVDRVGIGAPIHNWVPAETISAILGQDKWWAAPVATLVGISMYADIFGTLPIAEIAAYGIMPTPGLVVDEKVLSAGKVLTAEEIGRLL